MAFFEINEVDGNKRVVRKTLIQAENVQYLMDSTPKHVGNALMRLSGQGTIAADEPTAVLLKHLAGAKVVDEYDIHSEKLTGVYYHINPSTISRIEGPTASQKHYTVCFTDGHTVHTLNIGALAP
jgi:hypothetical protein